MSTITIQSTQPDSPVIESHYESDRNYERIGSWIADEDRAELLAAKAELNALKAVILKLPNPNTAGKTSSQLLHEYQNWHHKIINVIPASWKMFDT